MFSYSVFFFHLHVFGSGGYIHAVSIQMMKSGLGGLGLNLGSSCGSTGVFRNSETPNLATDSGTEL